jgi:hypothetical protein
MDCGPRRQSWRLPLLLAALLAAVLAVQNRGIRDALFKPPQVPPIDRDTDPPAQQVLLTINFGDGRPLLNESARWRDGMTVLELLRNELRTSFRSQGTGESAFLLALNGVGNEGAGGRNWTYSVNGKLADKSFGVYELRPNDHVLWTFSGQR